MSELANKSPSAKDRNLAFKAVWVFLYGLEIMRVTASSTAEEVGCLFCKCFGHEKEVEKCVVKEDGSVENLSVKFDIPIVKQPCWNYPYYTENILFHLKTHHAKKFELYRAKIAELGITPRKRQLDEAGNKDQRGKFFQNFFAPPFKKVDSLLTKEDDTLGRAKQGTPEYIPVCALIRIDLVFGFGANQNIKN